MPVYKVRSHAESYGHEIGILLVDCRTPFIPGDVGNAASYGYPVLYRTVPGLTLSRLIDDGDDSLADAVVDAARALEAAGVRAITSDCGYMIRFQRAVATAVGVPVMLSSLLQIPFIASTLGPDQSIGIICANRTRLTPELLALAGVPEDMRLAIVGLERQPAFRGPILDEDGVLDSDAVEAEVVAEAKALVAASPDVGAILLECSNLPPYAHAVQAATGRPVFDFLTLIDFMHGALNRRPYAGGY